MTDRAMKTSLSEIVDAVNANKKVLESLQANDKVMQELLHVIYQRVEDMSMKFDETLNIGIKKPKVVVKKPVAKKNADLPKKKTSEDTNLKQEPGTTDVPEPGTTKIIKNVMAFFKTRYVENSALFDDILEENQAQSVFATHSEEIIAKKEGPARDKTKVSFLYQNLSQAQKKVIKEKMNAERDRAAINQDDDITEEAGSQSD
jgi:hypothetical protein